LSQWRRLLAFPKNLIVIAIGDIFLIENKGQTV